jgi:hypothetical protein
MKVRNSRATPEGAHEAAQTCPAPTDADGHADAAGIVVALCTGHRCAALVRMQGGGGLAASVARSSGGILVTAPCLQHCAEGAVAAVALRPDGSMVTGPSLWLGGLEATGRLEALGRWIEGWTPGGGTEPTLPAELGSTVLGVGPPVRLG